MSGHNSDQSTQHVIICDIVMYFLTSLVATNNTELGPIFMLKIKINIQLAHTVTNNSGPITFTLHTFKHRSEEQYHK